MMRFGATAKALEGIGGIGGIWRAVGRGIGVKSGKLEPEDREKQGKGLKGFVHNLGPIIQSGYSAFNPPGPPRSPLSSSSPSLNTEKKHQRHQVTKSAPNRTPSSSMNNTLSKMDANTIYKPNVHGQEGGSLIDDDSDNNNPKLAEVLDPSGVAALRSIKEHLKGTGYISTGDGR